VQGNVGNLWKACNEARTLGMSLYKRRYWRRDVGQLRWVTEARVMFLRQV
jgi:hypothetical protein